MIRILSLQKIVGNITFNEAVHLSCDNDQRYIKCYNFLKSTYAQVKRIDNRVLFRFVEISENLDILDIGPWSEVMNINDILNQNWSIYQLTMG